MGKGLFRQLFTVACFVFMCSYKSFAAVILPLGQSSKQPWTAKFFYAPNNGDVPAEDWCAVDFDDSEWGTIEGPISTGTGYYVTPWTANDATYWVRRHFIANDVNEYYLVYLHAYHDDDCEIYLNGNLIYKEDYHDGNLITVTMTEEMRSYFVEGDNVIAIKVSDTGAGNAYLDCGIEASDIHPLTNPDFDNGTNGWTWFGDGFQRGGQSFNYLSRFSTKSPFNISQTVKNTKKGLFKIQAQAFESPDNKNPGASWELYNNGNKEVSSYLYAGNTQHKIKNVFDEAVSTNIYRSNEYYRTYDDTYIPTYMTSTSIAFQNGMYENEFYAYIDTTEFNIGVAQTEQLDKECWVCFDNFRVEHIGDKALARLINDIEAVSLLPMEDSYKLNILSVLSNLNEADDYESKSRVIASCSDDIVNSVISAEQYAQINQAKENLQCRLDTGEYMSEAAILEARGLINNVTSQLAEGTITASETQEILAQLNNLNRRLNYFYLDIAVVVPGALGDSILSKVENFTDVKSLKLSGTLNDADFSNIQSRLSQLREIDMTDVEMTTLPNKFFYQRSLLEIVKLPAQLMTIGENAFYKCNEIRNIEFPTTLTSINYGGFYDCNNLQEVVLPEGFNSLGERAFYSCDNNRRVKLPSTLKSISSEAFSNNQNLRKVEFADGLTHINSSAFNECGALNNLKFPPSLYYIGGSAFAYNNSLSNVEFNEGLYQIADNAFYDCNGLKEVTLPSSLVLAHASPFDYCDSLMKVTCLSIEPPYMTDQIPYGLGMEGRELYVPALSINTYKQTTGWDKFQTIKPIDYLPENLTVLGNLKLTLPETIPADYKPNVSIIHDTKGTSYYQYGSLTVNGQGTLSMSNFNLIWDPNYQYDQYNRTQNYCTLINNSHLRSDSVSIDLYIRNDKWTFLTLPFDVQVSDIEATGAGATNWIIRKYDGNKRALGETSDTWVKMAEEDMLKAGEGYIIQSSRYINTSRQGYSGFLMKAVNNTNKNNIFCSSDVTVTLSEYESEFAHNRSWNLIGNPYPCYYDTRFMGFEAPITVWNIRNNTYEAYSPLDDSYILCPGEAFFVQCPVDDEAVVFSKDGRQTNRSVRVIEAPARAKIHGANIANAHRTVINLSLSDEKHTDRTRIVLNSNATLQYEMDKDASKFMSSDAMVPQIYTSSEGVNYAINERPLSDGTVALCAYVGAEGQYTISLTGNMEGYDIVLEDKAENKKVVLTGESSYTFFAEAGTYTKRFVLHIDNEATDVEDIHSETDDAIYSIEGIKMTNPTKRGIYIQNGKKILLNK